MIQFNDKEKEYMNYISEHIDNVYVAHMKYGPELCKLLNLVPSKLAVRIFEHDKSKLSEEEFEPYRQYFFPHDGEEKDKDLFNKAWEHHYTVNSHHPEYWIEDGKPTDMDNYAIAEMLLDWEAMSVKFGNTTYEYYMKERNKKPFSENTKNILDSIIYIFK